MEKRTHATNVYLNTMVQSELELEKNLISQLNTLGFENVTLPDTESVDANLKTQLEKRQISLQNIINQNL